MSEHIVVLGGGYVTITLAKGLRRAIRRGEVSVTVVSRENYQVWHGFIGEMLTSRISPHTILNSTRRLVAPARLLVGEVTAVDLAGRSVTVEGTDGERHRLEYDQVVFAVGTADRHETFPGLKEHAFTVKSFDDAFRLRNHLISRFEKADHEPDPAERRRLLTFVVAGGGYAGCEIAGELTDFARLLAASYPGISLRETRVVLVHPGEAILPELGPKGRSAHPRLVAYATRRLQRLGVELLDSERVHGVTPHAVLLTDGGAIPTATVISAIGAKPQPMVTSTQGLPLTEQGRIVTDDSCAVRGHPGVWAAGDCAAVPHPKGGTCPAVAIFALHQGSLVAANVLRRVRGEPPRRFTFTGFGQGASLGRRSAVAEIGGHEITGKLAWMLWRTMLWAHVPTWDRRLRLLADWIIWPLVGRDIVEMSVADADDFELTSMRYVAGEVIVDEAREGPWLHVILEGEAVLVVDGVELERYTAGATVGRRWRDEPRSERVVAAGAVRTVRLRNDQTPELRRLAESLSRMAQTDARTSGRPRRR